MNIEKSASLTHRTEAEYKGGWYRRPDITSSYWRSYGSGSLRIPEGFTLVIDTREQHPLFADVRLMPKGLTITRSNLIDGDYSIKGFENRIAIERKGVSDFFSYMADREKTVAKLERLSKLDWAALVIHADEYELCEPHTFTSLTREHVRGFLRSVRVHYNIHVYCSSVKSEIERFLLDHFLKWYDVNIAKGGVR